MKPVICYTKDFYSSFATNANLQTIPICHSNFIFMDFFLYLILNIDVI